MTGPVLVTGATGNLGGAVVRSLAAAPMPVRAAARDPEAVRRVHPDVEPVRLDFENPSTFDAALHGVSGLFLMRPPHIARMRGTVNALIDAANEAGCHIVFASVAGANRLVPHHRVETHLARTSPSWTVLRPGFFAQNLADAYWSDIVQDDRLYLPAGTGKVAFIDVRDVGDVVARAFAEPAVHRHLVHTLTGPEALDFHAVAAILTTELGRTVRYEPATVLGYLRHLGEQNIPRGQRLVQTVLHTGLRRGQAEAVELALPDILGRPARPLAQYVHDHRTLWRTQT